MSEKTISDLAAEAAAPAPAPERPSEAAEIPAAGPSFWNRILTAETGPGEIDHPDYMQHPLNFDCSIGLAQVLRGLTGLLEHGLRLAVLDVAFGLFRWFRGRRAPAPAATAGGPPA